MLAVLAAIGGLVALGLVAYSFIDIGDTSEQLADLPGVPETAGLDRAVGLWMVGAGAVVSTLSAFVVRR